MTAKPSGSGQQLYYAGIAAVAVVIILALWMLFKPDNQPEVITILPVPEPTVVVTEALPPEPVVEVGETPEPAPEVEVIVQTEPALIQPTVEPLPALAVSDPFIKQELLTLDWQPGLAGLINTKQMVQNLVVTVDNLAQRRLVTKHPVVARLDQPFKTNAVPDSQTYTIDPASYQRYEPYLRLMESVEPAKVLTIFERYQPLFEQAFAELGYPELTFKQRLQQALTEFLAIKPMDNVDTTLVRKSVAYTYADPAIESLSDLEKQVIRLGPANHQRLRKIALEYQQALNATD